MSKTIHANSGHTLHIESVDFDKLPEKVKKFQHIEGNSSYKQVKNFDTDGVVFMYLAKSKGEWLVWYRGGAFWSGFGKTIEEAINGAQKDGWMYA